VWRCAGEGPRVVDLLPERWRARSPVLATVGRLDKDTTGAQCERMFRRPLGSA
jgi:16S rRNA U516 pseudouridylate synthase RsuA-like enzyme